MLEPYVDRITWDGKDEIEGSDDILGLGTIVIQTFRIASLS